MDVLLAFTIALMVVKGTGRAVDRNLREVGPDALDLGINIGKKTTLEEWVVGEINSGNDVARMKGDLLGLGKEIVRIAVEYHLSNALDGNQLFRNELGGVQKVEIEFVFVPFLDDLNAEFPFWKIAAFNCLPEVASVEIGVFSGDFLGFIPDEGVNSLARFPMEFDEAGLTQRVDEAERVDSESLHHGQAAG